ncbi:MAG: metal-dependent hydrolase [Paraperlucidibaca sp.]
MARSQYKEKIVVRKDLDFGLDADDIPRYWMAGDAFRTRVFDAVQSTFPDGERYFISAVRAYRDRITDPVLLQEVKDFTMQEGQHGQVHTRFNERLRRQGINIDAFTRHTREITERRLKDMSAEYNIAMTAALEHFTAMMADLFFAEKEMMAGADPRVRAMFAWHAIEEMEHKAVAYDVMQKVAGVGYATRVTAMTHASIMFSLYSLVSPWFMLGMDGYSKTERIKLYAKSLGWMLGPRKGMFPRLIPMLASYYRPGFHPNDVPTVHNYQAWLQSYEDTQDTIAAAEAMHNAACA